MGYEEIHEGHEGHEGQEERHEGNEKESYEEKRHRQGQTGEVFRVPRNEEQDLRGLEKSDLIKNKAGKIVSKKASIAAKKNFAKNGLGKWTKAVNAARKAMGIKGFQAVGGKSAKGQALLKKARSLYKK